MAMIVTIVLAACGDESESDPEMEEGAVDETVDGEDPGDVLDVPEEVVTLMNTEGEETATATLSEGDSGVDVAIEGEGLPSGELGFHFHEMGSCELPDFESAGGHYNPTDANHGFDDPEGPHAGDMENIQVEEDGTVNAETTAEMVTLQEDHENTLYTEEGTALVIHSEADDYESQPSGEAGDRIACGVVGE